MKRIFGDTFRATGNSNDPSVINFNILGLHKKEYFDTKGDLIKIELYKSYDEETSIFTNLAITDERTYTRSPQTGLIIKRDTVITWYYEGGEVGHTTSTIEKYYSAKKGFVANKRARRNVIDQASMYLYSQLLANDAVNADSNVDDFESLTNSAQSKYINSNIQPLLDIITNSTDNTKDEYRDYITAAMQTVLLGILTINYK